jgi:hypothetical protein
MTFRNDHEAALRRAAALERELAETKLKLAQAEADAKAADTAAAATSVKKAQAKLDAKKDPNRGRPSSWAKLLRPAKKASRPSGMRIERAGPQLTARWTGWGTGNFVTFMLMFALPSIAAMVPFVLLSQGVPNTPPPPSKLPLLYAVLALVAWNVAALIGNRYNRVRVTETSLEIFQGYVPWPVAFRRKTIPLTDIDAFCIESDWDPESDATDYRVLVQRGAKRSRVTGAVSEEKAYELAEALGDALGVSVGNC